MESAFKNTNTFNQDIGDWNTSAVVKMNDMFYNASGFNQSLHSWDVISVNDFNTIFQGPARSRTPTRQRFILLSRAILIGLRTGRVLSVVLP